MASSCYITRSLSTRNHFLNFIAQIEFSTLAAPLDQFHFILVPLVRCPACERNPTWRNYCTILVEGRSSGAWARDRAESSGSSAWLARVLFLCCSLLRGARDCELNNQPEPATWTQLEFIYLFIYLSSKRGDFLSLSLSVSLSLSEKIDEPASSHILSLLVWTNKVVCPSHNGGVSIFPKHLNPLHWDFLSFIIVCNLNKLTNWTRRSVDSHKRRPTT